MKKFKKLKIFASILLVSLVASSNTSAYYNFAILQTSKPLSGFGGIANTSIRHLPIDVKNNRLKVFSRHDRDIFEQAYRSYVERPESKAVLMHFATSASSDVLQRELVHVGACAEGVLEVLGVPKGEVKDQFIRSMKQFCYKLSPSGVGSKVLYSRVAFGANYVYALMGLIMDDFGMEEFLELFKGLLLTEREKQQKFLDKFCALSDRAYYYSEKFCLANGESVPPKMDLSKVGNIFLCAWDESGIVWKEDDGTKKDSTIYRAEFAKNAALRAKIGIK